MLRAMRMQPAASANPVRISALGRSISFRWRPTPASNRELPPSLRRSFTRLTKRWGSSHLRAVSVRSPP
jgi:hypothetical protein